MYSHTNPQIIDQPVRLWLLGGPPIFRIYGLSHFPRVRSLTTTIRRIVFLIWVQIFRSIGKLCSFRFTKEFFHFVFIDFSCTSAQGVPTTTETTSAKRFTSSGTIVHHEFSVHPFYEGFILIDEPFNVVPGQWNKGSKFRITTIHEIYLKIYSQRIRISSRGTK